jgi:ribulose-phosphate 3-epimerase
MGIDHIGSQHQAFNPEVLEHIKKIKEKWPAMLVSVDGGVHMDTAQSLVDAGADRLVVGSTLYEAESIKDTLVQLSDMFSE